MSNSKRYISILVIIHIAIMLSLLLVAANFGPSTKTVERDVRTLLLVDDGYYRLAGEFVDGGSLLHNRIGPGVPLIYSTIYLFPERYHPYVRLALAVLFNIGTIIVLWLISRNFLSAKEYFVGSLFVILNPVFIHWTFKSTPDSYLAFFVALFAFFLLRSYDNKHDYMNFFFASVILLCSIFIRPSVLFIPPALILVGIFMRNKKLLIHAFLLLCVCIIGFSINGKICSANYENKAVGYTTGVSSFMHNAYLLDTIVRTGKIEKGLKNNKTSRMNIQQRANFENKKWQDDYLKKHPDAGSLQVLWAFTIDNPTLVLRKLYLNPIFIFTLAARHVEFYCNLVIVLITLLFVVVGMYYIPKNTKFWIIAGVISGYLLLFIIVHAYNRYSVAVLPILYVFAGKGFLETVKSMWARYA
jgi:4-amino-4-deoxy-L-arabinose transferase-like glycosyltransferase